MQIPASELGARLFFTLPLYQHRSRRRELCAANEGGDPMAERAHLDWFRARLAESRKIEPKDPAPVLSWLESNRNSIQFKSHLIGLNQVRDWSRDEHGNIRHRSGQ